MGLSCGGSDFWACCHRNTMGQAFCKQRYAVVSLLCGPGWTGKGFHSGTGLPRGAGDGDPVAALNHQRQGEQDDQKRMKARIASRGPWPNMANMLGSEEGRETDKWEITRCGYSKIKKRRWAEGQYHSPQYHSPKFRLFHQFLA